MVYKNVNEAAILWYCIIMSVHIFYPTDITFLNTTTNAGTRSGMALLLLSTLMVAMMSLTSNFTL